MIRAAVVGLGWWGRTLTRGAMATGRVDVVGLVDEIVDDEAALDAAVRRRVEALVAVKPRIHAEIRAMLRDFEGVPSEKVYAMAAACLVGSQRRAV